MTRKASKDAIVVQLCKISKNNVRKMERSSQE
jgi:hypothetical protein